MSVGLFSLGEPAVAQSLVQPVRVKAPPKRRITAQPDAMLVPEPR